MEDPEVLPVTEIPPSLKRLIRYVARGFYTVEHAIVVDMLVHHGCVKEDDLGDVLKYDKKQLRQYINTLKNDRFLKSRMRVETDADGRTTRHSYHFINYSTFVNVIKYKLDHMRRKIEMEERDSSSRASFKCPGCEKTFTDLEADQLFDPSTGNFMCTYCQSEVEEEASATQAADSRNLMAKFNEQIEPIFALLREVEDIKLSQELLEPEPTDIKAATRQHGSKAAGGAHGKWSTTKQTDIYGYAEHQVTVSMHDEKELTTQNVKPQKERPVWMVESTIEGANSEPLLQKASNAATTAGVSAGSSKGADVSDDIMRTLLAHEKTSGTLPTSAPVPVKDGSDQDTDSSDSEDEMSRVSKAAEASPKQVEVMESDDDMEEVEATVTVGGRTVSYHEISDALVAQMTPAEKEAYIKLGQEMYDDYD